MDKLHQVEGFKVIELHPGADPEKDEAWLKRESLKYPKEDFDREFLLKPVGRQDAYPVFGDYLRQNHENEKLVYQRSLQYVYRGWDFGKVHPCVIFMQSEGRKINIIYELYGTNVPLASFAATVLADSAIYFPGAKFVDWCDASGVNEKDDGRSSIKVLRDLGLLPRFRREEVEVGIAAIIKNLTTWDSGRPLLQFNSKMAPHLCDAMRGGYKRNPRGDIIKDGINDHPADAFRYGHQGIIFNISAATARSKTYKKPAQNRPLTDCELVSTGRRP